MKEKIDKLLHAQLTEKQKMYLAVLGVMLLQIILMILNVERIGGSAGSDWFNFGNWLFHNKYSGLTFGMLGLLLIAFLFAYQRLLPGYIILEVITFVLGVVTAIVDCKWKMMQKKKINNALCFVKTVVLLTQRQNRRQMW